MPPVRYHRRGPWARDAKGSITIETRTETMTDDTTNSRTRGARPRVVHGAGRPRPWAVFVAAFAVFCGLGGAWAVASPLMSVPDEPAHTIHAAAVVRGQLSGDPVEQQGWTRVTVPEYVAQTTSLPCFAFNDDVDASCQATVSDSDADTSAVTTAGSYDPVYYAFVGLPSLVLDGKASLYAMRGFSVILSAALLASAVAALVQRRSSRWSLMAVVVLTTPMVLFITGSVNPSSMEISAAVALFAWLTLLRERADEGLPVHRIAMVAVSASLLANTRSIGLLWLLVIVVASTLDLALWRRLLRSVAFWVAAAVIGAASVFSLLWVLATQSLSPTVPNPGVGSTFESGFIRMIFLTFENGQGYVGIFGWLDAPAPATTVVLWSCCMIVLVLAALVFGRGPARLGTAVLALAFVVAPPIIQGIAVTDYGYIWQSRYILAVLVCVLLSAGAALDEAFPAPTTGRMKTLVVVVLAALGVMQLHTFVWTLRRYVVGWSDQSGGWGAMFTDPRWAPSGGWIVWTVVFAAVWATGAVLTARAMSGSAPGRDEPAARRSVEATASSAAVPASRDA